MEQPKQLRGTIFVYGINLLLDHKNLVYAATLSESQRVMLCQLILEYFGPNIQNIAGFDNIVSDTLSRLPSTPIEKYKPCKRKAQYCANKLFEMVRVENNEGCFPLNLLIVQKNNKRNWGM